MTTDSRIADDLVLTQRIRATPDQVFDFLVEPDKLVRWMGEAVDVEPNPGGRFWLNVDGDHIASGSYVEVERPSRVVFTWGWESSPHVPPGSSTVAIDLVAEGDETVLTLTHSGLPGGQDDEHRKGWTFYLGRLDLAATGRPVGPNTPGGGD